MGPVLAQSGTNFKIIANDIFNKALEIIEAKYIFGLNDNQIDAIIHPQAIIHAMVNYKNGVTTALLNEPDMCIPISTLFFKFNPYSEKSRTLNILEHSKLEFMEIDPIRFPAIESLITLSLNLVWFLNIENKDMTKPGVQNPHCEP